MGSGASESAKLATQMRSRRAREVRRFLGGWRQLERAGRRTRGSVAERLRRGQAASRMQQGPSRRRRMWRQESEEESEGCGAGTGAPGCRQSSEKIEKAQVS